MFPKAIIAVNRFSKMVDAPPHRALRADVTEDLSNNSEAMNMNMTTRFIDRASDYDFSQPGLTPGYWYKFRLGDGRVTVLNKLGEDEIKLNTDFDVIESEVWMENKDSTQYVRLYGVTEENFWRFFQEKKALSEQIRICDGMLYTTIMEHLDDLSRKGIVESLTVLDYDTEPGSKDAYGTLVYQKQLTQPKGRKKKARKSDPPTPFNWQPSYVRKFIYKNYYLSGGEKFDNGPKNYMQKNFTERSERKISFKMKNSFWPQRLKDARVHNRTLFATRAARGDYDSPGKPRASLKKTNRKKTVTPTPTPKSRTPAQMSRTEANVRSSIICRKPNIGRLKHLLDFDDTIESNAEELDDEEEVEEGQRQNAITTLLPHFLYERNSGPHLTKSEFQNLQALTNDTVSEEQRPSISNHDKVDVANVVKGRETARNIQASQGKRISLTKKFKQHRVKVSIDQDRGKMEDTQNFKINHPTYPPARKRQPQMTSSERKKSSFHALLPTLFECNGTGNKDLKDHQRQPQPSNETQAEVKNPTNQMVRKETKRSQTRSNKISKRTRNAQAILEKLGESLGKIKTSDSVQAIDGDSERELPEPEDYQNDLLSKYYRMAKKESVASGYGKDRHPSITAMEQKRVSLEANYGSLTDIPKIKNSLYQRASRRETEKWYNLTETLPVNELITLELKKLHGLNDIGVQKRKSNKVRYDLPNISKDHQVLTSNSKEDVVKRMSSEPKAIETEDMTKLLQECSSVEECASRSSNTFAREGLSGQSISFPMCKTTKSDSQVLTKLKQKMNLKAAAAAQRCSTSTSFQNDTAGPTIGYNNRRNQLQTSGLDVPNVIANIDSEIFRGRQRHSEFQRGLLNALKQYKVTLESVISSRGYSISSITISQPKNATELKRRVSLSG